MGIELSNQQRNAFLNVIRDLNSNDIQYVILRRHESLPDTIPGSQNKEYDIDILVNNNHYARAGEIFRENSFDLGQVISGNVISLISRTTQNPRIASEILINSPSKAIGYVNKALKSTSDSEVADFHGYSCSFTNEALDLKLHVYNHLAHKSPMDGSRRRLEPDVENQVLENRINRKDIYVTSPPEELAHLICHCLFEYGGDFPEYYTMRCSKLVDKVIKNDDYDVRFSNILSNIFFQAMPVVKTLSENKQFDQIIDDLYKYDQY